MLDGEQGEKRRVDDQRERQRAGRPAVDGLGDRQIADEGNGVKDGAQEQRVRHAAIQHRS
jgi:hypothetical protein